MSGQQLKELFEKNNWNQKEIAAALRISPQSVTSWFKYKNVSSTILENLCDILDLKINDLYTNTKYEMISLINQEKTEENRNQEALTALIDQLEEKDRQLHAKDVQIDNLMALLAAQRGVKVREAV